MDNTKLSVLVNLLQQDSGAPVEAKKRLLMLLSSDIRMIARDYDDITQDILRGRAMDEDQWEHDVLRVELDILKAFKSCLGV